MQNLRSLTVLVVLALLVLLADLCVEARSPQREASRDKTEAGAMFLQ